MATGGISVGGGEISRVTVLGDPVGLVGLTYNI